MTIDETDLLEEFLVDDGSHLSASPYLLRPIRSLPAAKETMNLNAELVTRQDRRATERHATEKFANAHIPNVDQPIAFIVRDISKTGARIELGSDTVFVPKNLSINVPEMGVCWDCELRWRHGNEIGVAFIFSSDD